MADRDQDQKIRDADARRATRLFLSAVTHELRTPLNGILGMTELLEGSGLKPDQQEYAAAIRESGKHLLNLVNDILDISKLEAEGVALETTDFDPARLARSAVELLAPQAAEKGLELAVIIDPGLPAVVTADEGRLRQVLLNILGNAVKFTERGGALLRASAEQSEGRTVLEFIVSDTGAGASEAIRESIFDGYSTPGSGAAAGDAAPSLGLAIARRLIAAMGGELTLEDGALGGATFRARLPVAGAIRRKSFEPPVPTNLIVASRSAIVREALGEQIRHLGGRVRTVMTRVEARKAVQEDRGATLLIDASWAGDGEEAVGRARRAVALLSPAEREQISGLTDRGFAGYLIKPVRPESLDSIIRGALSKRRRQSPPAQTPAAPQAPQAEPAAPVAAPSPAVPVADAPPDKLKILMAEDNQINALLARTTLTDAGYEVEVVGDGAAAVEAAQAERFDLILMDMRMPGMDGMEAARRIRALGPPVSETPIIALTANDDAQDRQACLDAGMDAFFTKPMEQARLRRLAKRWTEKPKQAKVG